MCPPYGKLDLENEWVKLAEPVLWDVAGTDYAKHFVYSSYPAHPARIALGAHQAETEAQR